MIGIGTVSRLATSTASSLPSIAATTSIPRAIAVLRVAAVTSKSTPPATSTITGSPGAWSDSVSAATMVPTPRPRPPGVRGSWPIMVDSVMIVSVMVSIASPLMTGVASFNSTTSTAPSPIPACSAARVTTLTTPSTFLTVPLIPVVRVNAPPR